MFAVSIYRSMMYKLICCYGECPVIRTDRRCNIIVILSLGNRYLYTICAGNNRYGSKEFITFVIPYCNISNTFGNSCDCCCLCAAVINKVCRCCENEVICRESSSCRSSKSLAYGNIAVVCSNRCVAVVYLCCNTRFELMVCIGCKGYFNGVCCVVSCFSADALCTLFPCDSRS